MNNTINNNVNFQAKLDTKFIKGDKKRWVQIAKVFEGMTKQYPKDEFALEGSFTKGIYCTRINKKGEQIASESIHLNSYMTKLMKDFSDTEIAEKFKKLFKLQVKMDKIHTDAESLAKRCKLEDDNFDKFYWEVLDGKKEVIAETLEKDSFFKKMGEALEFSEY